MKPSKFRYIKGFFRPISPSKVDDPLGPMGSDASGCSAGWVTRETTDSPGRSPRHDEFNGEH